jgi:hypothetical protein
MTDAYLMTSAHSLTMSPPWRQKSMTRAAEEADGESSLPKKVFTILACLDDDEEYDSDKTLPQVGIPDASPWVRTCRTDKPLGRNLIFVEETTTEVIMRLARKNRGESVAQGNPIQSLTPDLATDVEAFEEKRQELLAEAKNLTKITSKILKDKVASDQECEKSRIYQHNTEEAYRKAEALKA